MLPYILVIYTLCFSNYLYVSQGSGDLPPFLDILTTSNVSYTEHLSLYKKPIGIKHRNISKEDRMKILRYKLNPPNKTSPHLAQKTEFTETWSFTESPKVATSRTVRYSSCSYPSTEWYSESDKAVTIVLQRYDIPSNFMKDIEKFVNCIVGVILRLCNGASSFCLASNGYGDYWIEGLSTRGYSSCIYFSDLNLVLCPAVSWTWDTWYQDFECSYTDQFCVGYIDLGVRVFDLDYGAGGVVQAHIGESAESAAEESVLVKNFCLNAYYEQCLKLVGDIKRLNLFIYVIFKSYSMTTSHIVIPFKVPIEYFYMSRKN
eukprot:jgi/Galph1/975/GphlegSOOS_G5643.1